MMVDEMVCFVLHHKATVSAQRKTEAASACMQPPNFDKKRGKAGENHINIILINTCDEK
jgi:hypothetical protein